VKKILYLFFIGMSFSQAHAAQLTEAQLGQILFLDPSFSVNRTMSCATCHEPSTSFSDHRENIGLNMV